MSVADPLDEILDALPDVEDRPEDDDGAFGTNLPAAFWDARPLLATIRAAAYHRARSADAVLGFVLARAAAATPPTVQLPAIVGAAGSLNMAVALIGASGGGKSTAKRLAVELVPLTGDDIVDDVPLGSGEGLIEAYHDLVDVTEDGKKIKRKRQTKRRLFAYLDEGQALAEMGGRKGATLMPTLRSAWTGDTLGQANASEDRRRCLPAGAYRFAVVVGFQPSHAVHLLDDAPGGTPQRFLWLSADDPNVPYDAPPWPGPLGWEPPERRAHGDHDVTQELGVPHGIAAGIRHAAIRRTRGDDQVDPLDAHHDLGRLKVAALLALLDNRDGINDEDWQLSQLVMATSVAVRTSVAAHARRVERDREESGHRSAIRREYAIDTAKANGAARRMAEAIGRHVHRNQCDGCRRRCVSRSTRSTDRHTATIDEAVDLAEAEGWIKVDGDSYWPGQARPA